MPHSVSIEELRKAALTLDEALAFAEQNKNDELRYKIARDACIQRFEYCIELSWKLSMKTLGSQVKHAKVAVREMARADLIDSAETWLDFIEARNETSHSYDEDVAREVFKRILKFSEQVKNLITRLQTLP